MEIDISKIGDNPLIHTLKLKASEFNGDGYIGKGNIKLPKRYKKDQTPHAKIFTTAELRKITMGLSNKALRIYLWFVFKAVPGQDFIKFNKGAYMKENDITSINTVKGGLEELIRYEFIAETNVKDVYWFNPLYFFRGDRLKKYPEIVKVINSVGI